MKNLIFIVSLMLISFNSFSQLKDDDRISGIWLSEKQDGKIEIFKSGNNYFGKLIWGKSMYEADGKTSRKDVKNPEVKLRKRDYKNLILLTNLTYKDGEYTCGQIYDTESGKSYSCTMRIKSNQLKIRAYLGISLFGRTTEWTRVN